jgi:DNA polymerase III subunit epsilon
VDNLCNAAKDFSFNLPMLIDQKDAADGVMEHTYYIPQTESKFLQLAKPIVFFDLETTGTSTTKDRIIEICAIKVNTDGKQEEIYHLINPTIPISPGATAVHGITDEMVADKPTFGDLAEQLAAYFEGCDLGGYNIKRFDVPMLMEEFHRFKKYPIHYSEVKLVDVMAIYHRKEKRDLSAAVKFYCDREHEEAHSAKADVLATIDILKRQLLKYGDLEPNTSFLHDYLDSGNTVDISGKFVRNENGDIVFSFGKHQGKLACSEPDYLRWMLNGEFPVDTKMVANRIYKNCIWENEINDWLHQNKLMQEAAVASALYTAIKYEKDIHPFTITRQDNKVTITYGTESPSSYTLVHPDAVATILKTLDGWLRQGD